MWLWANNSVTTQFLPRDLARFVEPNNGIRIELEKRNSSDLVQAVLDGRANIGIFADCAPLPGIQTVNHRNDRLALVIPKWHPLAAQALIGSEQGMEFEFASLSADTLHTRSNCRAQRRRWGGGFGTRVRVRSCDAIHQKIVS